MEGWIKIHRQIKTHWIWEDPVYLKAWLTILMTVNHEDKKILIEKELIDCNKGQSLLSLSGWAKLFGKKWTIQKVRTFFDLLKKDSMIITEGLRKTTRLTVCNYAMYQNGQQTENILRTDREQAENKLTTTNKNEEEGLRRKKKYIYSEFYDSEIERSEHNENYIKIIKILYGENNLGIPLNSVLRMEEQLSYEQFKKIWYLKDKHKFSITEILESMEDWKDIKKRKTIYKTFLTFLKNNNPNIKI